MVCYSALNSGVSDLMKDSGKYSVEVLPHEYEGKVILASGKERPCATKDGQLWCTSY